MTRQDSVHHRKPTPQFHDPAPSPKKLRRQKQQSHWNDDHGRTRQNCHRDPGGQDRPAQHHDANFSQPARPQPPALEAAFKP